MISASKFSYNDRLTCKFVSFTLLLGTLPDDSVTNMLDFRARKGGVPKLKDTTLKTHAYITSKQNIFGGKPYEKADFLRI